MAGDGWGWLGMAGDGWGWLGIKRIFTLPCQKRNGCPKLLSAIFPDFS